MESKVTPDKDSWAVDAAREIVADIEKLTMYAGLDNREQKVTDWIAAILIKHDAARSAAEVDNSGGPTLPDPVSGAAWSKGDILPLLEYAMQMTMKIYCDCERDESNICKGDCVGSKIWNAIHRARKLIRSAAEEDDWCDDCHGYTHRPDCPSLKRKPKPLVDRLVNAVYRSMAQYEDGTWWLDELKAKARVGVLLRSVPPSPDSESVAAPLEVK